MANEFIDTSMYPRPQNSVDTMNTMTNTVNQINQAKQFQQQFHARKGVADAMQGAIDENGNFDSNKFLQSASKDPRTAWMGPELAQQAAQTVGAQAQAQSQKMDVQQKQAGFLFSHLVDGMTKINALDPKDPNSVKAAQQIGYGMISDINSDPNLTGSDAAKSATTAIAHPNFNSYEGIAGMTKSALLRSAALSNQLDKAIPAITGIDTGGGKVFTDVNPITNPALTRGAGLSVANTLPATTTTPDATGKLSYTGNAFNPAAGPTGGAPTNFPTTAASPTPATGPTAAPIQPPALPQVSSQSPPAPVTAALSPAQSTMIAGSGAASSDRYQATINAAQNVNERTNILQNIKSLAQAGTKTGPGTEWQNKLLGLFANAPGVSAISDPLQKIAAERNELDKFMSMNTVAAGQVLGHDTTDMARSQTLMSNPNGEMNPQAVLKMANYGLASVDAVKGRANAMQNAVGGTYDAQKQEKFENDWRNKYNFTAYQVQHMDPDERKTFLSKMPKDQLQKLKDSREWLKSQNALDTGQ